jgi:formylmethanofuran dehydrogenase subunit B
MPESIEGCPRQRAGLSAMRCWQSGLPSIGCEVATWPEALDHARELIGQCQLPLVTGLPMDVATARSAVSLAKRFGGVMDASGSDPGFKAMAAIERRGLTVSALPELREQASTLWILGSDELLARYPRLAHRLLQTTTASSSETEPRGVFLVGCWSENARRTWQASDPRSRVTAIDCTLPDLPVSLLQWDRALMDRPCLSDSPPKVLGVVWSPEELGSLQSDVWVDSLIAWLLATRSDHRCLGLPLAGEGITLRQVCTWMTGYPGRVRFVNEEAHYDPDRWNARSLMERREVDLIVRVDHGWTWDGKMSDQECDSAIPQIRITSFPISEGALLPQILLPVRPSAHAAPTRMFGADGRTKYDVGLPVSHAVGPTAREVLDQLQLDSIGK